MNWDGEMSPRMVGFDIFRREVMAFGKANVNKRKPTCPTVKKG